MEFGQDNRITTSDSGESICKNKEGILEILRKSAMSRMVCALGSAQIRVLKCAIGLDIEVFCKSIYRVWTWS